MAILITVIGFGVMVLLHELGHFVSAKKFGVTVHEFAIGMGPKIFSFGKGETKYSLRLLPLGGYVKLEGENDTEESDNPHSFSNISPLKRIVILVSGALMNILLGILLFAVINMSMGIKPAVIGTFPEEFTKNEQYFKAGDKITRLNNSRIHTYDDVMFFMNRNGGNEIDITLKRGGKELVIEDFKPYKTDYGYKLGVIFPVQKAGVIKSVEFAMYDTVNVSRAVFVSIGDLVRGRESLDKLSGPVEIVSVVGDVTSKSEGKFLWINVFLLFAMISVNLGIFNLLPFPALDGGSIVFAVYELITKKKVSGNVIGYAGLIGFVLLIALAVYVTVGDIIAL